MLTSRRDYLLRLIDEVARLLARVVFKHRAGDDREALQTVVQACERLFGREADQLFQFTPEQHYFMLTDGEPPQLARDKVLVYAALNAEAGGIYLARGNAALGEASLANALRLAVRARTEFGSEHLPDFAPHLRELAARLPASLLDASLRAEIERLEPS